MNRTQALIGVMAGVILVLAIALAYAVGSHSPASPEEKEAARNPSSTPAKPRAVPRAAPATAPDPDAALRRWIVGGWAELSTNCETDTGVFYDARGRYGASGEEGRWRIEGGRLLVTVTHEAVGDSMAGEMRALPNPRSETMMLTREGPDRMTLVIDAQPFPMMRCPEAQHGFVA